MKQYFAYIRVSTIKQGEKGVSLTEQREIVERYATQHGLAISRWFEERETASKIGRPLFNEMLTALKSHQAQGVIIHKVDRSARNRWDWAEVMQLKDFGVDVHFAGESLDLSTPSGILAADIQAVMAVHYSRNLSEETKKGYYGRLKQGLCPFPAPLGYKNNGRGKSKTIDPVLGPIVRTAFELYATGRYSVVRLTAELHRRGLRTRDTENHAGGKKVGHTAVAAMLSNPFYIGVLRVKKTNQVFAGNHAPLIPKQLFESVQAVLAGKAQRKVQKHYFAFSRLIQCRLCSRLLVGEIQKGHVYYRCHSKHASTIFREWEVKSLFDLVFQKLKLSSEESTLIDSILTETKQDWEQHLDQSRKAEELRIAAIDGKLERLTDAYIENVLDKADFERKKTALILERQGAKQRLSEIVGGNATGHSPWVEIVELIKTASLLYERANLEEKQEMVKLVMSNRIASGKTLDISLRFPFSEIAKRHDGQSGCPPRARARTFWRNLIRSIIHPAQNDAAGEQPLCA